MNVMAKASEKSARPYLTLDELVNAPILPATEAMPAALQKKMGKSESGVYVRSKSKPKLDFTTEEVPGATGVWRVIGGADREELVTAIPGQEQIELSADAKALLPQETTEIPGYRPPWVPLEYMPPLTPFRAGKDVFFEPRAFEEPNRLNYPWRSIGIVFSSNGSQGSGVLVGPNLLLTAGHVAPWGASSWSMEFVPAYRAGDRPYGSSFVQTYRGYNTGSEVSGHDYVICKLYNPLGNSIGWMGAKSWGNEDEYYRRRYVSSGYPGSFGTRPAVEVDMGLRDIDNDSPGLELEFSSAGHPDLGPGWSGGPLWLPGEGPSVVGVLSGSEKDEFDPRFQVFAGGRGMIDLIRFGLDNWRP